MKVKRLLSLLAALAMTLALLAGCTGSGGSTASGGSGATGSQGDAGSGATVSSTKVEDVYGGDLSQEAIEALQDSGSILIYTTTIDFANNKFDKDPVMQKFNEWSKKYYNLSIKYRYRAWSGTQFDKFMVDYAADDAPDYLSLNYYMWPKAGLRNILYTLDDLKAKGVVGFDHPLLTATQEANDRWKIGKDAYSVGIGGANTVICGVNLDLFEKYNVKSPVDYYKEGTWDMDTYVKCAKELTRTLADGTKIWGAFGWNYNWFLMANDCALISWNKAGDRLAVTMNDPKVQRTCNIIAELYSGGYSPYSNQEARFRRGELGVYCATNQNLASALKQCTFKWDIVPFPYGVDNTSGQYAGEMSGNAVVSTTKNPQGVVNYIICRKVWAQLIRNTPGIVPEDDFYNTPGYTIFNKEQVALYESFNSKVGLDLSLGVGNLAVDYGFWNNLRDGSKTYKECVDTYESVYEEQCRLENEEADKAAAR